MFNNFTSKLKWDFRYLKLNIEIILVIIFHFEGYNPYGVLVQNSSQAKPIYESVYELSLRLHENMSPEVDVLVFSVHQNEVIADSVKLKVKKCLKNKVRLEFIFGGFENEINRWVTTLDRIDLGLVRQRSRRPSRGQSWQCAEFALHFVSHRQKRHVYGIAQCHQSSKRNYKKAGYLLNRIMKLYNTTLWFLFEDFWEPDRVRNDARFAKLQA